MVNFFRALHWIVILLLFRDYYSHLSVPKIALKSRSIENLAVESSCFDDLDNLIYKPSDLEAEISKIRKAYAEIQKEKKYYYPYKKIPGNQTILVSTKIDLGAVYYGNNDFVKNNLIVDSDGMKRQYGGSDATFYFDDDFDLRMVIVSVYDHWDGFFEYTEEFYFEKGAQHPFFYYTYGFYDYPSAAVSTHYQQRLYFELNASYTANCPKLIRALKKVKENPDENFSMNSLPNEPMADKELQNFVKKVVQENYGIAHKNWNVLYSPL